MVEYIYMNAKSEGWKIYTTKNSSLSNNQINALMSDNSGRVWIGTESGLNVLSADGTWTIYNKENSVLYNDEIQALATDGLGRVWVGTYDGLYMINSAGQWTNCIGRENNRLGTSINALAPDHRGLMWVGTNRGLSMFELNGVETIYTVDNSGLADNEIVALGVDQFNNVWIGTDSRTISVLSNQGHWGTYRGDANNILNNTLALQPDKHNRVWIGTDFGINVLTADGNWAYPHMQWESMLSSRYINAFAWDEEGRLWVGTFEELLVVDVQGTKVRYTPANSGLPSSVRALATDDDERLWIGTQKGLGMMDLSNGLPRPVSEHSLGFRAEVRKIIDSLSEIGKMVFLPIRSIFAPCYITLLLLIILSVIVGVKEQDHDQLFYGSIVVLAFSFVGAVLIWLLMVFLYGAMGD